MAWDNTKPATNENVVNGDLRTNREATGPHGACPGCDGCRCCDYGNGASPKHGKCAVCGRCACCNRKSLPWIVPIVPWIEPQAEPYRITWSVTA